MYVCTYVCMYVCMHVCMYVFMYVCMYVCMYICMYLCMYLCMYVCSLYGFKFTTSDVLLSGLRQVAGGRLQAAMRHETGHVWTRVWTHVSRLRPWPQTIQVSARPKGRELAFGALPRHSSYQGETQCNNIKHYFTDLFCVSHVMSNNAGLWFLPPWTRIFLCGICCCCYMRISFHLFIAQKTAKVILGRSTTDQVTSKCLNCRWWYASLREKVNQSDYKAEIRPGSRHERQSYILT